MNKEIYTTDIRKDIKKMMSFLHIDINTKYSINTLKHLQLPEEVQKEIDERHELTIRYIPLINEIEINAYNEDHHNGNSYSDIWHNVKLKEYSDKELVLILNSVRERLYNDCFIKEKGNIIKNLVNISLRNKLKKL